MPPSAAIRRAKAAVRSYFCRCIDVKTMTDLSPTYSYVHSHFKKVYATLVLACVCTILGVSLDFAGEIGGRFTFLVFSGSMFFLHKTPSWRGAKRICYMMAATFFMGASIVPCFRPFVNIDHGFLMTIIGAQALCHVAYWLGAMRAKRTLERSFYVRGVVYSYMFLLVLFVAAFLRYNPYIVYFVMLYMACYPPALWAYSQEMAVKLPRGDGKMDCVSCCLRFYTDYPAILGYAIAIAAKDIFYDG
ncbi:unnamed protein product [Cuscuta epithymum]|uniref:Uncharacterized protein n=1 Tax=Cuscuta epithymum TaxID=186058 RepID=A0AAV0EN12_9ASTE|nr:unnamed protein product [Cuscuta epithymum]